MKKDMVKGWLMITAVVGVVALGAFAIVKSQERPIDIVKEAYEEYGYSYAMRIIDKADTSEDIDGWLEAINYLGEAEFGHLFEAKWD